MPRRPGPPVPASATPRLAVCLLVGAVVSGAAGGLAGTPIALCVLLWVAVTATLFVIAGWLVLWPMDAAGTRADVRREEFRPVLDEIVVVCAALAGLGSIGALLALGGTRAGPLPAGLALLGVFASWASLHLMYAARYAATYYATERGAGIDFNDDEPPRYRDFFYFSYNLGMTYQVSDTSVTDARFRSIVLRQCLLSYVFGAVILATTVNLVSSVFTG
ncbi:DUF1345 domain-containing protein [Tsukamurella sp. 8F]|uniref:DUF1345 domain-containing protein n=1 Tax=unclassified Tsukamurella TaxID=2633480 RepID=UPI0023B8AC8E|nr:MULTISPECIES: DUF1345 domain-containing protein [unclassified Tsukamurella]MDF0528601.1 DUF1345 domain-containing protein [Tsukamurella sp. 8J]MDF0585563.1 DUF1345 domain-containing protein [Tsukamurella sp. 8F]